MSRGTCKSNRIVSYLKKNDQRPAFHLESGQRFRSFIKGESYASKLSEQINLNGRLQPEFLSTWIWATEMIENVKPDMHILIDGTPRRLAEARVLESALSFFERPSVDIVYMNVSREWAISRMEERGRLDDNRQSLLQRLNWFETDVVPAIDFYRLHRSHRFHEINGEQTVEEVHDEIIRSVF